MGELPIFSAKAHVFQIDPDTKKRWLPSSTQAVPVSFYHDTARGIYRVISVEAAKILINSTIVPTMVFTKTSQKFGQWSDSKANTVYGIGFASEAELTRFQEKFQEVKELSQTIYASPSPDSFSGDSLRATDSAERDGSTGRASPLVTKPSSHSGDMIEQLRYENDRLKIALAQSSANAKKWEMELTNLRSNNARLSAAMEQNELNTQQWNQQLAHYQEENSQLKKQLSELESSSAGDAGLLKRELIETKEKLEAAQQLCDIKDKELFEYEARIDELKQVGGHNLNLRLRVESVEEENTRLRREVADLHDQMERVLRNPSKRPEITALQQQLSAKINELYEMNDRLADLILLPNNE